MRVLLTILLLAMLPVLVNAKEAAPLAADPQLESRLQELSKELRCLKCQNQSIYDSKSGFANEVRDRVREMMRQGKTDTEIKAYLKQRFGDFILYQPPFSFSNILVWAAPITVLIIALVILFANILRQQKTRSEQKTNLDENQSERLNKILSEANKAEGESL